MADSTIHQVPGESFLVSGFGMSHPPGPLEIPDIFDPRAETRRVVSHYQNFSDFLSAPGTLRPRRCTAPIRVLSSLPSRLFFFQVQTWCSRDDPMALNQALFICRHAPCFSLETFFHQVLDLSAQSCRHPFKVLDLHQPTGSYSRFHCRSTME